MRSSNMKRIAVVGAAGLVGRELLRAFAADGVKVTAVVRGNPDLVVSDDEHDVIKDSKIPADQRYGTVINLAYPTGGSPYAYPEFNKQIFATVCGLMAPEGRLIHVSTQAVFGLALDRPINLGHVKKTRDDGYVENKIEAEHYFDAYAKKIGVRLDIVRLGNVWGRASGAWALPIVQRLITGRAVGVVGRVGFCNATDVANAAAYLSFLAQTERPSIETKFHHLAEFSALSWDEWINPIAEALGVVPVYAEPAQVELRSSLRSEIRFACEGLKPRPQYQRLATERVIGSYIRSILRMAPERYLSALKEKTIFYRSPAIPPADQNFLNVVSAGQQFKTVTADQWTAPVDRETSLQRVIEWIG